MWRSASLPASTLDRLCGQSYIAWHSLSSPRVAASTSMTPRRWSCWTARPSIAATSSARCCTADITRSQSDCQRRLGREGSCGFQDIGGDWPGDAAKGGSEDGAADDGFHPCLGVGAPQRVEKIVCDELRQWLVQSQQTIDVHVCWAERRRVIEGPAPADGIGPGLPRARGETGDQRSIDRGTRPERDMPVQERSAHQVSSSSRSFAPDAFTPGTPHRGVVRRYLSFAAWNRKRTVSPLRACRLPAGHTTGQSSPSAAVDFPLCSPE